MATSSPSILLPRSLFVLILAVCFAIGARAQVSFFAPSTYAGTGDVFTADFNGDGKPDILTSHGDLNLGKGDGTFSTTTGLILNGFGLAVADFNGDGQPDILKATGSGFQIMFGRGDGSFQAPIATGVSGASLAGDLNGDGKADLLALTNNNLVVYIGKGDGTFDAGVSYPVGNTSSLRKAINLGDFNGDGVIDVAVSLPTSGTGQVTVFLGNGDGTLQPGITSTALAAPTCSVAGDFNNDGRLDLVIADAVSGIYILLGNGDGTFAAPTPIFPTIAAVTSQSRFNQSLAAGDVNGDGNLDLVILTMSGIVDIHIGDGTGAFPKTHSYKLPDPQIFGPFGILLADFSGDGKLDIAVSGGIALGNGDGTFQGWSGVATLPFLQSDMTVGRFDNNALPGVAALWNSTINPNKVYIYSNDGTGALKLAVTYDLPQPCAALATADINNDGNLDLVLEGADATTSDWGYTILLGKGDGTFQSPLVYAQSVATSQFRVIIVDFNRDGRPDLAFPAGNSVAVLLGNGDGTFAAPVYFADAGATSIVSADFNGS